MNTHPVRGVLFDFDGTLAHLNIDFALMRACVLQKAREFDGFQEPWTALDTLELIETVREHWAKTDAARAQRFWGDAHEAVREIELNAAGESYLFPATGPLLRWLRQQGLKVGIVTRNCEEAVFSLLGETRCWCDALLCRERVNHVKPHPEHLTKAMQALNLTPAETLMVGDGVMDMVAAKRLHIRAVGVTSGRTNAERLKNAGADWVVPGVDELPALMRERGWVEQEG